ncbi:MAG: tail fiber protein [Limisphaerales bacterium]
MSNPYTGEIRLFAGNFAPNGWAFCNGQIISIAENDTLFNLIGTTYGGDGQQTFALPDLQGRVPVHQGSSLVIGQKGGAETVMLTGNQIPIHTHPAQASANNGSSNNPANNVWANWTGSQYSDQAPDSLMNASALSVIGNGQPHENLMPFQTLNFIICLYGIFPSQN